MATSRSHPPHNLRILISGIGIGGPALAFWLRRYGMSPTLTERAPAFREGGYMLDVWGVGYDLVQRMGLLDAARDRGYFIDRISFVDERGRRVAGFDADVFRRALSGRFFSIPRGDLARIILDSVGGEVEAFYSTSIDAMREDASGVDVELSNGSSQRFDLVIGADGLRSRVRECVFGQEEQFEHRLGYYAASFVTRGYPHRDERTYLSFARPGRQISRYAMRDDRSAFLFVFTEDGKGPVPPHDMSAHKASLHARFGGDGWECPEILARLDEADDLYFDSVSQIRMAGWSRGRVGLIGDAAYCPSLLAGAGSAFAMLGAYILAGELERTDGDHAAAFAAYEGRMHPFIEEQQGSAERFARYFAPRTGGRNLPPQHDIEPGEPCAAGSVVLAPHVLERVRSAGLRGEVP
jgi:2-polyprenyl-6-methoxyphenol hydroxylase-like FAD-dependent oxidoreductase